MERPVIPGRGADGFDAHYHRLFAERWPQLRAALLDPSGQLKIVRENGFSHPEDRAGFYAGLLPTGEPGCHHFDRGRPVTERDRDGLCMGYVMDLASVLAARVLPLAGAKNILDLCAAPGGKALALLERADPDAELVLNDRSPARRARLSQVLRDYVPKERLDRVRVTGHDGRRVGLRRAECFDAILLDAPCSSEGHVLADPAALTQWSPRRIQNLCRDQYALLTSALLALRPGGSLLYATCALTPEENDGVITRLLERGRHPGRVERVSLRRGEPTEHGVRFLPDAGGFGPLYFSLLRKAKD